MYRSEFQLFSSSKASDAAWAMSSTATNASRPSFATEAIWLYARIGTTNAVAKFSIRNHISSTHRECGVVHTHKPSWTQDCIVHADLFQILMHLSCDWTSFADRATT